MSTLQHDYASGTIGSIRIYFQREERTEPTALNVSNDISDLSYRHHFLPIKAHQFSLGFGYRYITDDIEPGIRATLEDDNKTLYSLFLQDDIHLLDEQWLLTLGLKLEKNEFTGTEVEPDLRILWRINDDTRWWLAVSRAVRQPSRSEHDELSFDLGAVGPSAAIGSLPILVQLNTNDDYESEKLLAFESGWRWKMGNTLSFDAAFFLNDYSDISALKFDKFSPANDPVPHLVLNTVPVDRVVGKTYGTELSIDWTINPNWTLYFAYSFLEMDLKTKGDPNSVIGNIVIESSEGNGLDELNPEQQAYIRSRINFSSKIEFDLWLRYVDQLPGMDIDHYVTTDLRLGWQLLHGLNLSLVGRHLLDDQHPEFNETLVATERTEVEREFYLKLEWQF